MSSRRLDLAAVAHDYDTDRTAAIYYATPAWKALCEWAEFHGIDPSVVIGGDYITRSASGRCIRYTAIDFDSEGRKQLDASGRIRTLDAIEQGEAPPLPFPDLVQELMR